MAETSLGPLHIKPFVGQSQETQLKYLSMTSKSLYIIFQTYCLMYEEVLPCI